jgi:general secretion pathway protein D
MNYTIFILLALFFTFSQHGSAPSIFASSNGHAILSEQLQESADKREPQKKKKRGRKKNIVFNFLNEDLVDIITMMAAEKQVNIVLPKDPINVKVTLSLEHPLSRQEAWDVFQTLLDMAGFSMIVNANGYQIVKTSPETVRESLPLYIGVLPPATDQKVRYLHYPVNIRLSDAADSEILRILKGNGNERSPGILSDSPTFKADVKIDVSSNALIITDKATNIISAMQIVNALDQTTFKEVLEVIQLQHVPVAILSDMLNQLQIITDPNRLRLEGRKTEGAYFQQIALAPIPRTNSLILRGRRQAVERFRDFIFKYVDVELETGKSILHVYQLQYLDADTFAITLDNIIKSSKAGGPQQAQTTAQEGGIERYFKDVIIKSDKTLQLKEEGKGQFAGNNNLIIAARNDDWEHIRKLIEQLDTPQPQVILEVLIADLTMEDIRSLGSTIRNPMQLPLPTGVNFQSAQTQPVLLSSNTVSTTPPPTTLQSDLLRLAFTPTGAPGDSNSSATVPAFYPPGTALFQLSDPNTGQTWGIFQIQKTLSSQKVLSHPHIIATNNKKAMIEVVESRFLPDSAAGAPGGGINATRKWIDAKIDVNITPRISSADTVGLYIKINIDQFTLAAITSGDRNTRIVETNAQVRSGAILALGGLGRIDSLDTENEVPLLSRIPLIGWLFKSRRLNARKTNLIVFISPTIIQPRLRKGMSEYTQNYAQVAQSYLRECNLFDSLRDPITRWFFRPGSEQGRLMVNEYLSRDPIVATQIFQEEEKEDIIDAKFHVAQNKKDDPKKASERDETLKNLMKDTANPFAPESIKVAQTDEIKNQEGSA